MSVQPSEELSELPLRVAEISRDQRQRGGALLANGTRESRVQVCFCCVAELISSPVRGLQLQQMDQRKHSITKIQNVAKTEVVLLQRLCGMKNKMIL